MDGRLMDGVVEILGRMSFAEPGVGPCIGFKAEARVISACSIPGVRGDGEGDVGCEIA